MNFLHKFIPSDLQRIFKSRVICESRYFPFVSSLHKSHSEQRSRKSCNNGTKFPQNLTLGSQNLPGLVAQTCGLLDLEALSKKKCDRQSDTLPRTSLLDFLMEELFSWGACGKHKVWAQTRPVVRGPPPRKE